MKHVAIAMLLACTLGCGSSETSRRSAPPPQEAAFAPQPMETGTPGPYAYNPAWSIPSQRYVIVEEVEFEASHTLEECTREFAQGLVEHPDARIFPGEVTARSGYGDPFHAHLIEGDRDTLLLPEEEGLVAKVETGTLVLVTSPVKLEMPEAQALVPAQALSLKIEEEHPSILTAQPFVKVLRAEGEEGYVCVASLPHNEGEAILGIYSRSEQSLDEARISHGGALLEPRFEVEVDGWQKLGTYPFPPDLPPDAAGTQTVSLELGGRTDPVEVPLPGRPTISSPQRPVATRADVFASFYGLSGLETRFISGYGYVKEATPTVAVQETKVDSTMKNAQTTIDLGEDAEGGRTVFFVHRVATAWRETGGFPAALFSAPPQEIPTVFEKPRKNRPVVRSSAAAFMRQIHFTGTKPRPAPSGNGMAFLPGSIMYDAARGFGALRPSDFTDLGTALAEATDGDSSSSSAQSVTNVYINVWHDPSSGLMAAPAPAPTPENTTSGIAYQPSNRPTPISPYQLVSNEHSGYHPSRPPMNSAASAAGIPGQRPMNEPNVSYFRDPQTGQLYQRPTSSGQMPASYSQGGYAVQPGWNPIDGSLSTGQPIYRRQRGW